MKTYVLTETRQYRVRANSREEAEELLGEYGPEVSVEEPVEDLGVIEDSGVVEMPEDTA